MQFEWNDAKAASNFSKHSVSFDDATLVWAGRVVIVPLVHPTEARSMALGVVDGVVLAVVYTTRGDVTRIISARFASRQERRIYAEA